MNSGRCDFYDPKPALRNALYRNNRDGTFTDVTEKAGVAAGGYGQGVAVGDYDADGWPDLYVTQYGRSILYHNNGDGTFSDVSAKAGVAAPGWASSAVWFDYDNDGRLDLFVCRFVDFDKSKNKFCGNHETGDNADGRVEVVHARVAAGVDCQGQVLEQRTRAGKAPFDESEDQQSQQRQADGIKKCGSDTRLPDKRRGDVRGERNQTAGDVRCRDGHGAYQSAFWIGFLQAKFKTHHEVNPFFRMLRQRFDDRLALFGSQSV